MKWGASVRKLNLSIALIAAGFAGLAAFLTMQDAESAQESVYGAPLSADRLVSTLDENLSADLDTIEVHAKALLDRAPRRTLPRSALASVFVQRGEIEAFEQIFYPLFNTDRANTSSYVAVLAIMSRDPRVLERVKTKVRDETPFWGGLYLRQLLAQTQIDVSEYSELVARYPNQQAVFVREVMAKFNVDQAYTSFKTITARDLEVSTGIIDPDFTEEQFSWPFGWWLDREIVSREPNGGLAIVFFGRGTPVIAQQIIRVEEGVSQLLMQANGEASRTKGYFKLEARCWQGMGLADLTLDDVSPAPTQIIMEFDTTDVPDCNFVHIRLLGQAGAFPAPVRLRIQSIKLRSVANREAPL